MACDHLEVSEFSELFPGTRGRWQIVTLQKCNNCGKFLTFEGLEVPPGRILSAEAPLRGRMRTVTAQLDAETYDRLLHLARSETGEENISKIMNEVVALGLKHYRQRACCPLRILSQDSRLWLSTIGRHEFRLHSIDLNPIILRDKIRPGASYSANLGNLKSTDAKEQIRTWLNEERLSPEEVQNPGAFFTFKSTFTGRSCLWFTRPNLAILFRSPHPLI